MRICRTSLRARRLARAALLASALPLLAATALAQSQGRSSRDATLRQRNAEMMREIDIKRREGAVREVKPEEAHPILPYARGKEDFRALQLVNNEMMRAVFVTNAAGPTDYERVAEAAAEINKRATRLKSHLQLPEQQAQATARAPAPDISDDGQLRASLRELDKAIMEFVSNPGFRQSGTVDVRHSAAAAESLTRVAELSRAVRLGAGRIRKARESEAKRAKG